MLRGKLIEAMKSLDSERMETRITQVATHKKTRQSQLAGYLDWRLSCVLWKRLENIYFFP